MSKKPFFTIVIPTLNEEKYLPLLLGDLTKQSFKDFEIIHVDGSSEDKTVRKARSFSRKLALKSKIIQKRNVSVQRNAGGKLARGEWTIFMDADDRLPSYFLQGIKYQLEKKQDTDVFTCWIEVEKKNSLRATIQKTINLALELFFISGKASALGSMIGVRTPILRDNQFDSRQMVIEDSMFVQQLMDDGYAFQLFKEPSYNWSLRRIEKEGMLKMTLIATRMNLRFIQGKDFQNTDSGWVMKGGSYYEKIRNSPLKNLQHFVESASEKQLKRAKKLWKYLEEFEF